MAVSLSSALYNAYRCNNNYYYKVQGDYKPSPYVRCIKIPLTGDVFEVPVFAFPPLRAKALVNGRLPDAIITELEETDIEDSAATFGTRLAHCITRTTTFTLDEENPLIYHTMCGAIFDSNWVPIFMASWLCQRTEDATVPFEVIQPYFRIHPICFTTPINQMERCIGKRIPKILMGATLKYPSQHSYEMGYHGAIMEVANCPFEIFTLGGLDIHESDEEILRNVEEHLEDVAI